MLKEEGAEAIRRRSMAEREQDDVHCSLLSLTLALPLEHIVNNTGHPWVF